MTKATTNFGFPYPELGDSPDTPRDIKALAERSDAVLTGVKGDATLAKDGTLTIGSGAVTSTKIAKTAIQGKRVSHPGGSGAITVNWTTPFPDTAYTVTAMISAASNATMVLVSRSAASCVLEPRSPLTAGTEIDVIAVHD
ncbi:MAG: hypothetical protein JST53_00910 [Actinobacteria bacterium]|nr:hypothetical protein [Actinomycetota bacterium]